MSHQRSVIAVLDDEPQMRKALRRLLTCHGFSVAEYERASDFLETRQSPPADCLVLDLHMPGVSGCDVLSQLAEQGAQLPVVVITGHDEPGMGERVRALGASAYLLKPVDEEALLNAIKVSMPAAA